MNPTPIVAKQSYGKSRVRLSRVHRIGDRHEFMELTVDVELTGDFQTAYTEADNSAVVATDTMKNTVYVLARRFGIESMESFSCRLGQHFLESYAQVRTAMIRCKEITWTRMNFDGIEHLHAFVGGSTERRVCELTASRDRTSLRSGLEGLQVLKTSGSGFAGFVHDLLTTLPDTDDRILATTIEASWPCVDVKADWTSARQAIRAALLDIFANQYSKSVQQTLFEMAKAAFKACANIDEIDITMPNQHHVPINLTPFGMDNPNEVFVPTDEPHGRISATIRAQ